MTFTSNETETKHRLDLLREYMTKNVLTSEGSFVCKHAQACKRSARACEPNRCFFEGQLSYIGNHYDLSENGRALRILIIPMDTGHGPSLVTLETRRQQVDRVKVQDNRNQHMWGTVLALRLAVGRESGKDSEGELLEVDVDGTKRAVHLFDCYAMANVRLCSATVAGSRESKGTRNMSWNCLRHLEATINVLKPNLCIVQGSGVTTDIDTAPGSPFRRREQITDTLALLHLNGREMLFATFRHPSRNWFWPEAPYLRDIVAPTIHKAREELGLPVMPVH